MAKRQEQESARSEISEVAPNVLRMELPISMPGLGHVNCYALLDDEGATVVDPGLPGPRTWRAIQNRLKQAQLRVKDVHTVIVTHSHPDHFGGAARFAKEAGARVIAHQAFRFGAPTQEDAEVSVDDLAAESGGEGDQPATPAPQQLRPWARRTTPWGGDHPRPPIRTRRQAIDRPTRRFRTAISNRRAGEGNHPPTRLRCGCRREQQHKSRSHEPHAEHNWTASGAEPAQRWVLAKR